MSEDSVDLVYTGSRTLRVRFRALDILGQAQRGELRMHLDRQWRAPASSGQPPGTVSQRVFYFRGNKKVAVAHRYVLPDGTIGASGLPDPKWLRDGDVILAYRPGLD